MASCLKVPGTLFSTTVDVCVFWALCCLWRLGLGNMLRFLSFVLAFGVWVLGLGFWRLVLFFIDRIGLLMCRRRASNLTLAFCSVSLDGLGCCTSLFLEFASRSLMRWEPTLAAYRRMHARLLPEWDLRLRKLLRDVVSPSSLYCESS
jgi:hypothetical protein